MEGIDPGDLVIDILVDELPGLLAHAAREVLAAHISPQNGESPEDFNPGALGGEDLSLPHAGHHHSPARPVIEGASGARTT